MSRILQSVDVPPQVLVIVVAVNFEMLLALSG